MKYNKVETFKYTTSKILPSVYDESLSYSELLAKVISYLNTTITNVDEFKKFLDEFVETFDAKLKPHVYEFLQLMYDNGELKIIIDEFINEKSNVLDEKSNVLDEKLEEFRVQLAQTNTNIVSGLSQKVDKNGNEQVTLAMLSQDIKKALNNGTWTVNVNTSDLEDESVTSSKRTPNGDAAYIVGTKPIDFDFTNRFIHFPPKTDIITRDGSHSLSSVGSIEMAQVDGFNRYGIYYNTKTEIIHIEAPNIDSRNIDEFDLLIGTYRLANEMGYLNGNFTVNGKPTISGSYQIDKSFDEERSTYTEVYYRYATPVINENTITFKGNMRLYHYSRTLGHTVNFLVLGSSLQDGETEQTFEWTHNTIIVWDLESNVLKREVYPNKINYRAITLFRNIDGKLISGALFAQYESEMLSRQLLEVVDTSGVIEKGIGRPIKINNISKGRSLPNGAVVVGNEYWAFYASNDTHTNYNTCDRFVINDDYTFTHIGSFEHNWGHCNSLDYCEETDTLILGNGSGDYTLSGKIFIIENVQSLKENTRNTLADVATIIDVGMDYGAKVNVIWGDSNAGNYNVAHVITNDNKNITRIILGRTDGSFNGSFVELKQYAQTNGLDVVQGAVYGNDGYIYVGLGHGGAWYAKQRLQKDGSIDVESVKESFYDENGSISAGFTQSISMYQDKLLLRTTRNGGEVYVLCK